MTHYTKYRDSVIRPYLFFLVALLATMSLLSCSLPAPSPSAALPQQNPSIKEEEKPVDKYRHIPEDVAKKVGMDPAGLQKVAVEFNRQIEAGMQSGAQLAVYKDGELVMALAGGKDVRDGRPMTNDLLLSIRSTTKALTSLIMARFHERGFFKYEDPVAKYWPEFAKNGKEQITIAQVMSHRAGIPQDIGIPVTQYDNRETVARAVENLKPIWAPGSKNGYHASNIGWISDELAMRFVGKNISTLVREDITGPLGIKDVYIGLPQSEYERYCYMAVLGATDPGRAAFSDFLNTYQGISLPLSWVGGVATARDLAKLFNIFAFEGTYRGTTFIKKETQALISKPTNSPGEMDLYLLAPIRWGLGYITGETPGIYGSKLRPHSIGHAGGGANTAWADPVEHLSVVILCNGMRTGGEETERSRRLADLIYASIKSPSAGASPVPVFVPGRVNFTAAEYANREAGFSIKYPADWKPDAAPASPLVFKARAAVSVPNVEVVVKNAPPGTELSEALALEDLSGRGQAADIKLISSRGVTLADGATRAIEVTAFGKKSGANFNFLYLITIKGDTLIMVRPCAYQLAWEAEEAQSREIAYSLSFR